MAIRKKFIEVKIPAINSTVKALGTPEELDKKTINLDLSRKIRGKGIEVIFKIQNNNGKLIAFPKKIQLMKSYIQRMMRKRTSYVEDSFQTPCKDARAIIKPLLITRKKVSRVVRKNLRNTTKEFLIKYLGERNYLDVCNDILDGVLQREMLPKLKKVYPLSFTDIRIFETKELEKAEKPKSEPKVEVKEEKIEIKEKAEQEIVKETESEEPKEVEIKEEKSEKKTPAKKTINPEKQTKVKAKTEKKTTSKIKK